MLLLLLLQVKHPLSRHMLNNRNRTSRCACLTAKAAFVQPRWSLLIMQVAVLLLYEVSFS
jgi:hypothetical protein